MRHPVDVALRSSLALVAFIAGFGVSPALAQQGAGVKPKRPPARAAAPAPAQTPRAAMTERERELTLKIAGSYAAAGRHRDAAEQYRKLVAAYPAEPKYRIGLADSLKYARDLEEAIAAYEAVLDLDPGNVEAEIGLGQCHAWRNESVRAIRHLEGALERDPASVPARLELARLYVSRGYYRGAREYLTALKGITPRSEEEQAAVDEAEETFVRLEARMGPEIGPLGSYYGNSGRFHRTNAGAFFRMYPHPSLLGRIDLLHAEFRQGSGRVERDSVRGALTYMLEHNLSLGAGAGYHRYEGARSTAASFGEVRFEPLDRLHLEGRIRRFDLVDGAGGTDRGIRRGEGLTNGGASLEAVRRRIQVTEYLLAADQSLWRPLLAYAQAAHGDVDGGNAYDEVSAGGGLDLLRLLDIAEGHALRVKYGLYHLRFREEDPDYFSPEQFTTHTGSVEYELGGVAGLEGVRLMLEPGFQWLVERRKPGLTLYGGIWWQIGERFGIELEGWYVEQHVPFRSKTVSGGLSYHF